MISQLIIHPEKEIQREAVLAKLGELNLERNHPDLFWIDSAEEDLGIVAVRRIIDHFKLKPYSATGKAVVIVGAEEMTTDAQNALLKTLEEPPAEACLILTASTENSLLPTILSRCQIIRLTVISHQSSVISMEDIENILKMRTEERFGVVEKTENKEELLKGLLLYYKEHLNEDPKLTEGAKLLLEAEEWQKSNVNIRGILEYLMLRL